ncbi:MAG: DegT/DnrJ/EryC1/StrS family aminotransferase [Planctomycetes bacterium]|nr:DegT/DnrJ/EryC1/StrS family aminotransferase [Planctomycetota bacterium]
MATLLFVVGGCADALSVAPLVHAASAAGHRARLVHLGDAAAIEAARAFGLPAPAIALGLAASRSLAATAATRLLALAELHTVDLVLACGHGAGAVAAMQFADALELPRVQLDAGVRDHGDTAAERRRKMLDAGASLRLCGHELQRLELLRERHDFGSIAVIGSLAHAGALAVTGASAATTSCVGLALEHPAANAALRQTIHDCLAPPGLPIQDLGPAALEPLAALRQARLLLTDSHGWQELAAAFAIPCVTIGDRTGKPETVECGGNRLTSARREELAQAIDLALAAPAVRSPYALDAPAAALAAIAAFLAPRTAPAAPAATTTALPGDGDWTGRLLGAAELERVGRAIRSGTLNSTKGTFVTRFEQDFAARMGRKHAIACASGSAAVHVAIAALRLQAGDEVITTPITDMGALTPILYEGGVPVFADVDPVTLNVTVDTLRRQRTARTRAIVVTHLFGRCCDMAPITGWANEHGLRVIEDCAQSFLAEDRGRIAGTQSHLATFSLQQGKHMTTGEGGVVTTDDPQLARAVFLAVNKAWGYGDRDPDHYFPALNYRLTELQGAVALAQLDKLAWVVQRRGDVATALTRRLAAIPGLQLPEDPVGGRHTYWKYAFLVDPDVIHGGALELGKRMRARGVACVPRYIQKPAFECRLFQLWRQSPVSALPLSCNDRGRTDGPLFQRADYPGAVRALERVVVLPINELWQQQHLDQVASVIEQEARVLAHA